MGNWFTQLFAVEKPTHAQLKKAQINISAVIAANIRILEGLHSTRERVKAIEKLRTLHQTIQYQNKQILLTINPKNNPAQKGPVHDAAMQTSREMSIAQAFREIGKAALAARNIIQKQVPMRAVHAKKRSKIRPNARGKATRAGRA